jgi:hypothetical protein
MFWLTKVHRKDMRKIGLCRIERCSRFTTDTELEGRSEERVGGRRSGRPRSGKGVKRHRKKEE